MSCGIYKITNILNQHSYIGQSIDIITRWRHHRNYPKQYSHYPLYRAFEKYGLENFQFEILEECLPNELNEKEIYYIALFDTYKNGYNQTLGGSAGGLSIKLSKEDIYIIYDLLQNSTLSQNDIAMQFHIGQDTISEINHGKTRRLPNYTFPLRKNKNETKYCIDCGCIIKYGIRCKDCNARNSRIVERPSRETLKQLIRTTPFTQIAKQYGVTDNSIRKWCIAMNLPTKVSEIKKYSDQEWRLI